MNFKNSVAVVIATAIGYLGVFYNNQESNNRNFNFSYFVSFDSTDGKKFESWIPYPESNEVQKISNIIIETKLNYEILDEINHGNKYVYIYDLDGFDLDMKFKLSCDVERIEHSAIYYNNIDHTYYLKGSNQVPVGSIFDSIISENSLNSNDMRNVYDYVLNGMHYGKPISRESEYFNSPWLDDDQFYGMKQVTRDEVLSYYEKAKASGSTYTFGNGSSLYACDIGVGNCTDYHSYFISLSRSLNVPARFHMGFPIPDGNEGRVGGYHCWADYYVDDKGWVPVDISEADKNPEDIDYFFGNVCKNRVEFIIGRDFNFKNYNGGKANIFIYPIVEINDIESSNFSKNFYFKNL